MQRKGNINFVLVGARATGKTVYLTSLYLNEKSITAQDERTIEYLKPMSETLLGGEYPSATAGNLHELMFNYKDEKFSSSIQIDDVDGYFVETLSQKDEHTQTERDRLIENMKLSEGIIFFFPYQELFNEKSIKEFNYQVDTIVAKLKEMYTDRSSIPIPAVIAVSKWDDSSYYQKENEDEEALSFIDSNKFLRLAKEKIEVNFTLVEIIPLSAIGKNINELQPYNLKKPIEFFLEETYSNWVNKINELEDDKEALLNFLYKIHFDMKFYNNGKYDKLYKTLEKEYAKKMLEEAETFQNIKEYTLFEEENNTIINSLLSTNRDKLLKIKQQLTTTQNVKRFSGVTIASSLVALAIFSVLAWNANKLLIKSETELFADITTEYKNNNYEDAQADIKDYLSVYKDTVNLEHKQKILEFKSHVDETLKKREREKKVVEVLTEAQKIVADKNFNEPYRIDEIFTSMNELRIDNEKIKSELLEVKDRVIIKQNFLSFKDALKNKNFDEALSMVQTDWGDGYATENNKVIVCKILDKALNKKVEELLEDVSDISTLDEFNNLINTIDTINNLKNNTNIKKISYTTSINHENKNRFIDIERISKKYQRVLHGGVLVKKVSFGTKGNEENEPLGFECNSEYQIILKIDTKTYHFNNSASCKDFKISWINPKQIFKKGIYNVNVLEEDLTEDDHYDNHTFNLSRKDLLDLSNGNSIEKNIGRGYFLELQGNN
jgi:hypothetical protein